MCETTLFSPTLQIMFVEHSSKLDELVSKFSFDKSSVHALTKRSADRELVVFEPASASCSSNNNTIIIIIIIIMR